MANRYWVGGTGNWNLTNTTNWSTSSGGPGGASVPTETDDVYIDANSGTGLITGDSQNNIASCQKLDFTGYTGSFQIYGRIYTYGDVTLSPSMTYMLGGTLQMNTSGSTAVGPPAYLYPNGVTINSIFSIGTATATNPIILGSDVYVNYLFLNVGNGSGYGYVSGPTYSIFVNTGISPAASSQINITSISSLTMVGTGSITGGLNTRIYGGNFLINSTGTVTIDGFTKNSGLFKYISGTVVTTSSSYVRFFGSSTLETENSLGQYITFQGTLQLFDNSNQTIYFNKTLVANNCNVILHNNGTSTGCSLYSVAGSKLVLKGGSTISAAASSGSNINGTLPLSFEGNSTWSGNGAVFSWNIPVVLNAGAQTINIVGPTYFTNTLTYTSGIINHGSNTFITQYGATLNVNSNCAFYNFSIGNDNSSTNNTLTINGLLYINNVLTFYSAASTNFATTNNLLGTGGFNTSKIYCNTPNKSIVFNSGITYTVRDDMISIGSSGFPVTYKSYSPTVQAIYTLNYLATQANIYTNGRLMNSSLGQTVWVVNGSLSGTTNWGIVPVPTTTVDIFY